MKPSEDADWDDGAWAVCYWLHCAVGMPFGSTKLSVGEGGVRLSDLYTNSFCGGLETSTPRSEVVDLGSRTNGPIQQSTVSMSMELS